MGLGGFVLVLLAGALASSDLLEKHQPRQTLTCSQGLDECTADESFRVESLDSGPVEVTGLDVKAVLCCKKDEKCKACLLISVRLRILDNEEISGGQLREDADEDEDDGEHVSAAVTVCYYSGPNLPRYKVISFRVTPAAHKNREHKLTVVEYEGVFLGSSVNVRVRSFNRSATFPPRREVCPSAEVEECEECRTPRVIPVTDEQRGVVNLTVADEDAGQFQLLQMCVKRGEKGLCLQSSSSVPLHAVTPCMCFEVWMEGSSCRSTFCPFTEKEEFRENVLRNMFLSVGHSKTNEGRPVLSWNLTAPCRLEAEVWPCRMGAGSGQGCSEVPGFRVQHNESSQWWEDSATLWTTGSFVDIGSKNRFLHCVMFEVDGKIFGPLCQHDTHRQHWSVPILATLLFLSLVGVAVCFLRSRLRGCVSDWERSHCSAEACSEVLLLHASGADVVEAGLVCQLGAELSQLGFGVSLDLWSQAELSTLGPGPWLHSKLSLLQRRRGKALLVLSGSALDTAQACWDSWIGEKKAGPEGAKKDQTAWDKPSPCFSDVFGSALSCVFSAHLKGGAAERFVLVHFDSQKLVNGGKVMPILFQGLELYNLPSESRQLLAELCPERPESFSMRIKRLLWLRRASRKLTKGLKNSGERLRPHAKPVLTQVEILEEETLPLHM
ncbi:uncharacterized protein il17rc isoform X2 [Colossoma macropomum]|uniref:uncharacterized protein il17rc isoform X2 n=1 Tax=Colossoma macropomum TaxID=42526 RepID=UPI0018651822|nr:uncharacterized protein il17rc isoform X2 [Colossoma macropomum]